MKLFVALRCAHEAICCAALREHTCRQSCLIRVGHANRLYTAVWARQSPPHSSVDTPIASIQQCGRTVIAVGGPPLLSEDRYCCGRAVIAVGGPPLLWEDRHCCGRAVIAVGGPLLLWEGRHCCGRARQSPSYSSVGGLWEGHHCCGRAVIPVGGPSLLWEGRHCCGA